MLCLQKQKMETLCVHQENEHYMEVEMSEKMLGLEMWKDHKL